MNERTTLSDRLLPRRPAAADDDPDACDDCGVFGVLRGANARAAMLELRMKGGGREAFPYALLERLSFDPSVGLTLRFLGAEVRLLGRNLARPAGAGPSLLDALLRHRAAWVGEVDELRAAARSDDAVVVTRIEVAAAK